MRRNFFHLTVLLVLMVPIVTMGCFSFPATTTTTPSTTTTTTSPDTTTTTTTTPSSQAPVIQAWLTPSGITPKGTAALNWNVTNATSVVIDQGIGSVPASGSRAVSPDVTTTYTVTAYYSGGTVTNAVTLAVAPAGSSSTSAPSNVYEKDWLASKHTLEYHYPGCSIAQHIPLPSRVWFDTTMQAKAAGFHPCPVCKPPK
jgi:zona occludens toxin (predicted ATPase)